MTVDDNYAAFAARIVSSGFITDPWFDGEPRFSSTPVVLSPAQHQALCRAGESLALVLNDALQLLLDDDDQRAAFLPLPPTQLAMLQHSGGLWHGLARADVFVTRDGLQVTELNSDTPTGEPEAIVLGALAKEGRDDVDDACAPLPARLVGLWKRLWTERVQGKGGARARIAAIVYPTEFTEDLSLIRLYRQLLEEVGFGVVLGSPFNLDGDDDGLLLFGQRPSLVLRHYKTDWWGERRPVWTDDPVTDPGPLVRSLRAVMQAEARQQAVVVNPLGAIGSQNKRLMAFCWERIHRFPTASQKLIEEFIPYSVRLETMHEAQLIADKNQWVIKSDYGAEGEEVILGVSVDDVTWRQTIAMARPGRFIAQRYFQAERDASGLIHNHGVFVVGGEACGVYTRLHGAHTDAHALSVPTLVRRS